MTPADRDDHEANVVGSIAEVLAGKNGNYTADEARGLLDAIPTNAIFHGAYALGLLARLQSLNGNPVDLTTDDGALIALSGGITVGHTSLRALIADHARDRETGLRNRFLETCHGDLRSAAATLSAGLDEIGTETGERPLITRVHYAMDVWNNDIPTPDALLGVGLFRPGALGMLFGEPGLGKSHLALQLALAVARGEPLLGLPTTKVRVGILSLETPIDQSHQRLRALAGPEGRGLESIDLIHAEDLSTRFDLAQVGHQNALIRITKDREWGLVILDAFSRCHLADERDGQQMGLVLAACDRIRIASHAALLLVHHEKKPSQGQSRSDDMNTASGSRRLLSDPTFICRLVRIQKNILGLRFGKVNFGVAPDPIYLTRHEGSSELVPTDILSKSAAAAEENRASLVEWIGTKDRRFNLQDVIVGVDLTDPRGDRISERSYRAYLSKLVDDGILERFGHNRNTMYIRKHGISEASDNVEAR